MGQFLLHYTPVAPTTWAYLSSLLMVGLFFKFNRFWSVRNLDLALLILLAPGLLLEHFGREMENTAKYVAPAGIVTALDESEETETSDSPTAEPGVDPQNDLANAVKASNASKTPTPQEMQRAQGRSLQFAGYFWLFSVTALLLLRVLLDPGMVRRPLLEPNLSTGGLAFLGCSLFVFLMANVISSSPTDDDLRGPESAERLLRAQVTPVAEATTDERGPGNAFLHLLPTISTMPLSNPAKSDLGATPAETRYVKQAKSMAILSHLAVVIGIVGIGYRHFANIKMGIGAATLYLMLPYTSEMTGRVPHVLPAALIVWAILCYRKPLTAGLFIGMAIGVMYYPIFLLPLWLSFYWQRGLARFVSGVLTMLAFNALLLILVSENVSEYLENLRGMLGIWWPKIDGLEGIWGLGWSSVYRLPVLAAFAMLSISFAIWPARKNLGTLLSCTSAVMLATQFWHGHGGGLYMAWYLPTLLLTIFRPNLEDRIALTVLGEGWLQRRRRNAIGKLDRVAHVTPQPP